MPLWRLEAYFILVPDWLGALDSPHLLGVWGGCQFQHSTILIILKQDFFLNPDFVYEAFVKIMIQYLRIMRTVLHWDTAVKVFIRYTMTPSLLISFKQSLWKGFHTCTVTAECTFMSKLHIYFAFILKFMFCNVTAFKVHVFCPLYSRRASLKCASINTCFTS